MEDNNVKEKSISFIKRKKAEVAEVPKKKKKVWLIVLVIAAFIVIVLIGKDC